MEGSVNSVRRELMRLRKGQGLARPSAVLDLSAEFRAHLASDRPRFSGPAEEAAVVARALREAIGSLSTYERLHVEVEFNLVAEHSFPTLTARQESLASSLRCAAKTVRRHADQALESLALILATTNGRTVGTAACRPANSHQAAASTSSIGALSGAEDLHGLWKLSPNSRVDIICSEIPEGQRPAFASPKDRNYLRYAKFADLDSLIYVHTRLVQLSPTVHIRDFAPSEYHGEDADMLVIIGGPPWNAKYREFLPHLPFHFEPHPLGEDDPLVVPGLGLTMGPRWSPRGDLLEDLAVFTRLTMAQGTTIFLLGGCLTLGVLGAAKCFLEGDRGGQNARYVADLIGQQDFVLVTEARRLAGITDVGNFQATDPLLLLALRPSTFAVIVDNTPRYTPPCGSPEE